LKKVGTAFFIQANKIYNSTMQSIKTEYCLEDIVKKSRFIGVLMPCLNESDVVNSLRQCQRAHPNASHIAFAYRIKTSNGFISRFNDAGEPSGTAGKPIFQHLEGKDMINALLVVIRYFGGIKLGAGGLARAYGNAAKRVIEIAELFPYIELVELQLVLEYKQMQSFEQALKKLDGEIINQDFAGQVQLTIKLPKHNLMVLAEIYSGIY
jgi:uncharacterized YigZ family protein